MHQILQSYLRRLTNLSGSNRSLLLLRLISEQCIDLHRFDYALNNPSFQLIEDLVAHKGEIPIASILDSRDKDSNRVSQQLKKIQRTDKFIFDERGSKDLYIGWPFIRGKFLDDTPVRAPLLFFPVTLNEKAGNWTLRLRSEVNITFNKSFILAYSFFNKVPLDEELLETTFNDFSKDSTVFRTELYELLKNSNIEINFNQENFRDVLQPFMDFKRADFETLEKTGQLKLFPEAVLGIFPQAGSYLVPDYLHLIENQGFEDLEEFFFKRRREDMEDESTAKYSDRLLEENTFTPFELDSSQERAIGLIKKGNSLIVQGPPGTGKSQLIANLICDYIARGKNVLLVCQKRAALDVVYNRLKQKELHDFIGLVHDFKNDRKDIFEKISQQIDRLDEYRQKNNSLDSIQLERTFQQASRKIDQSLEELEEFRTALFDESECGKSAKELYLSSNPEETTITLNQEYRNFHYPDVQKYIDKLSIHFQYHQELEGKKHFWVEGKSFAHLGVSDLLSIQNTVDDVFTFQQEIEKELTDLLSQNVDFESAEMIASKPSELDQLIQNLDNERVYKYFLKIAKDPPQVTPNWLLEQERILLQCFKGHGLETSLKSNELGRFQEALEHAINARKGLISWIRWKIFSKDKIFITRVIVSNELKGNKEGFQILLDKIDNRLNYEHLVSQLMLKKWLSDFPANIRKIDIQNWFFYQKLAFNTYELLDQLRPLESLIPFYKDNRDDQIISLKSLERIISRIPKKLQTWGNFLSHSQIRQLTLGKHQKDEVKALLKKDFDKISEYHQLKESYSTAENKVLENLLEFLRSGDKSEEVLKIFKNSLAVAWIDHIETKYPILRAVSSQKLETLEKILKVGVDEKKSSSGDILLLKSRERTYEDLEFNRLNNRVTYRELYHQVTKKKRIWPLRRVISNYSEELFKLIPCWMTSPESASAIFPMEEMFDLVIFDEASQCYSEKAIPALYRGKQVVIAGDSKQLKPFDLYKVRWEEDNTEDIPELEIDSLLDLASQHLPNSPLTHHYRSRSMELIEFSNKNFYENKLESLPEFETQQSTNNALEFIKVEGVWENNTNHQESVEVVKVIFGLLREDPSKSIGVVTFNARQQSYILDMLEAQALEKKIVIPESLFVKNIENVQGDERDVIIFSTAYAPDKSGRLQMRFGPLNNEGGENRLNVAVTRAKEKIFVISSILPTQIAAENLKNPGPRLLKEYLQFVWEVTHSGYKPSVMESTKQSSDWYLHHKISHEEFHHYSELDLKAQLNFADITVSKEDKYLGLILTDDEKFHESISMKESMVYYPNRLSDKKWPYTRFFSRTFWIDKQTITERLKIYLNRISN